MIFLFTWVIFRFQPLIFQGANHLPIFSFLGFYRSFWQCSPLMMWQTRVTSPNFIRKSVGGLWSLSRSSVIIHHVLLYCFFLYRISWGRKPPAKMTLHNLYITLPFTAKWPLHIAALMHPLRLVESWLETCWNPRFDELESRDLENQQGFVQNGYLPWTELRTIKWMVDLVI